MASDAVGTFHYSVRPTMIAGLDPAVAAELEIHDRDLEQYLNGPRAPWTPALGASVTPPTLGDGALAAGRYRLVGSTCEGTADFRFGTSGAAAGSGFYTLRLPVPPRGTDDNTAPAVLGDGFLYDDSASTFQPCVLRWHMYGIATIERPSAPVGAAVPWTWAADDQIRLRFSYEIDPGRAV